MSVAVIVGTVKGAFVLRSDASRSEWRVEGPHFPGWTVTAAARNADGEYFVGTSSYVYGTAIQRSKNLSDWQQVERGPQYDEGGDRKMNQIWRLDCSTDTYYAGVDEAGLFRSTDGGAEWEPVSGLNDHPTRKNWCPGNGGLCAHSLIVDEPKDRVYCGISAVGLFRSDDGGDRWHAKNEGVQIIIQDKEFADIGFCVHAVCSDVDNTDRLWRQEHTGMFRSRDGGESWERIENGLASRFGFPLELDQDSKDLFAFPLTSDEYRVACDGKFRVFRSRDRGDSWEPCAATPEQNFYGGVLRGAMSVDHRSKCGIYVGSTSGTVHISNDGGDQWQTLPLTLPRILSVDAFDA